MNAFDRAGSGVVRLAAATGVALTLVSSALAAPASAATIAATKPCYVNTNPAQGAAMTIIGTGFFPGDQVSVSGGTVFFTTIVAANGDFAATTRAPVLSTVNPGSLSTTLTATDDNAGGATVSAATAVKSANLAVSTKPGSVKNVKRDKVTFSFSGFTPGQPIFGYYMRKKILATVKFGDATGPCGLLRQKALLYPGGRPHHDAYDVAFESSSRYRRNAFPRVTGTLNILRF
jgi:hypothetical protein